MEYRALRAAIKAASMQDGRTDGRTLTERTDIVDCGCVHCLNSGVPGKWEPADTNMGKKKAEWR